MATKTVVLQVSARRERLKDNFFRTQAKRDSSVFGTLAGGDAGGISGGLDGGGGGIGDGGSGIGPVIDPATGISCIPTNGQQFDVSSFTDGVTLKDVFFDGLFATPDQYTATGGAITPVTTLEPGTTITYTGSQP